jgi:hypothetical protein
VVQRAFAVERRGDRRKTCRRRGMGRNADARLSGRFLVLRASGEKQRDAGKQKHTARTSESRSVPGMIAGLAVGHCYDLFLLFFARVLARIASMVLAP